MKEVIYVDVLLFVNLFVNYFLLRAAALLAREQAKRWRLAVGAALGSVYALIIFLPALHPLFLLVLKCAMALSMVLAAFGRRGWKAFCRLFGCFLAETFLFGGIHYAVYTFLKPGGMIYGNSAVYYNISVPMLIAVTAVCYALSRLISRLMRKNSPDNLTGELTVRLEGKQIHIPAMIDSGNGLSDPFRDEPVTVVTLDAVKELFPPDTRLFLTGERAMPADRDRNRMRIIPYASVGGAGNLYAFRADSAELLLPTGRRSAGDVLLAVTTQRFDHGRYAALVNPRMFE